MDKLIVKGGRSLSGTVTVSSAKNSALKLIFATLLAEGTHVLRELPRLRDIQSALDLVGALGCEVSQSGPITEIRVPERLNTIAPYELVRKMRASILVLGPLLARMSEAQVSLPGGCAIGTRPINLHLEGLKSLGAELNLKQGYVSGKVSKLRGTNILFETSTVGGTENILMASVLAEGTTTIENAAKEPEIVDLCQFLIQMGAKIHGHGTSVIQVEGVSRLVPTEFTPMKDRIEAGTWLIAGAITGGRVEVVGAEHRHLEALNLKLRECGFETGYDQSSIWLQGRSDWSAADITTAPHPQFPTDLQAQWMALMCLAQGTSVITETVFENRFMHVQELCRLGANISPKTRVAVVRGVRELLGAPVMATDLRASASLVLAGLAARGETEIQRIYHLDRGYENLEQKIRILGGQVRRISD